MHWLLAGYIWLFIHRPFEVWPWLGDLHVERVYMLGTMAAWTVARKRWLPNPLHAAYAFFATAVVFCWGASPWAGDGQMIVEKWLKTAVFYVLLVTTVWDERGLKRMIGAFVAVMGLYLLHACKEYASGRHVYRMGTPRMVGVDDSMGDPNSFGASIVIALPFVVAAWQSRLGGKLGRTVALGVILLSVLCVLLTGSRSSLLALVLWAGMTVMRQNWKQAIPIGFVLLLLSPGVYLALPEALQRRFETIVNPDAGPKNAQVSGEGRLQGLENGWLLFTSYPATGCGPGAWRPATGSLIESHNLYGQVMGEMGLPGVLTFGSILGAYFLNLRRMKRLRKIYPEHANDFAFRAAGAVGTGLLLLLFLGNFGHNLFRFSWLWYGGFLLIARAIVEREVAGWEWDRLQSEQDEWEAAMDAELAAASADGWQMHEGHALR